MRGEALLLLALALLPAAAQAQVRQAETSLEGEIEAALGAPTLGGADYGVLVLSLDRGDTLVSLNADRPLTPASNQKLFSTAAALYYLGPGFRWSTYLLATGPVQDGVLRGDLVLYGTGDPTLGSTRFPGTAGTFAALADSLRVLGIRRVEGSIVADGSFFDPGQRARGWTADDAAAWYGASVAALSAGENTASPGGRPVPDPLAAAAGRMAAALSAAGIGVTGSPRSAAAPARSAAPFHSGARPATGRTLAVWPSPDLREVVRVTNHVSHNLFADALLRTAARVVEGDGSFAAGERLITRMLARMDDRVAPPRVEDGSGLSRLGQVTPRAVAVLLAEMDRVPERAAFRGSLPVAATPDGLERRMGGTPAAANLRAKTGTLRGVSALGGYVTTASGERLAFSIIVNGAPATVAAKRAEDRVGALLAGFSRP